MAQQKEQKRQKATDNKRIVHSVAIVTNRNFKEIYNKKVAIEDVNNGVAKVQELESNDICYYYVPLRFLKVLSDRESIEAYQENCGRMIDKLLGGSGDMVKRMFEHIVGSEIEYDKDGNVINVKRNLKKGDKELAEKKLTEGLRIISRRNVLDKDTPSNTDCATVGHHDEDSEQNFMGCGFAEGQDLLIKCSTFCRNYKVSPIYFISKLSEHLYCMHERYAPKVKE